MRFLISSKFFEITCVPAEVVIALRALRRLILNSVLISLWAEVAGASALPDRTAAKALSKYQKRARQFNSIIRLPPAV